MHTKMGEEVKKLFPKGKAQKTIANEWLTLWAQRHPEPTASQTINTVESRLSDCVKGKPSGLKFFFSDPDRRLTTFDVLGAGPEERAQLNALADEVLAPDGTTRLVVDVTGGPDDSPRVEAMFDGLKGLFLGPARLTPMTMLVTRQQYDKLPRSFDIAGITVETLASAKAARSRLDELGAQGALVASSHPCLPFERWAALRIDNQVALEPADALVVFRDKGLLEALPPVTRPLARMAEPEPKVALPTADPVRLRELAFALAGGEEIAAEDWAGRPRDTWTRSNTPVPQARRLAWARLLGVEASATEKEWAEALPKRLSPVAFAHPGHLEHILWHAHYAPAEPVAILDGGTLHVVNPPAHLRGELAELTAKVHDIAPTRRSKLDEYFLAAAAMTDDALLSDPFLEVLTTRFATDEHDRHALGLARVALLLSRQLRPRPSAPLREWRSALASLLGSRGACAASLRFRPIINHEGQERYSATFIRAGQLAGNDVPWLPPVGPVTAKRDQVVSLVWSRGGRGERLKQSGAAEATSRLVAELGDAPEGWAHDLISGTALRHQHIESVLNWYQSTPLARSVDFPATYAAELPLGPETWATADRELAFVLSALSTALSANPLHLPNGNAILPVGNGVFAELFVREDPVLRGAELEASLSQPVEVNREYSGPEILLGSLTQMFPMYWAETRGYRDTVAKTQLGPRLPPAVYLSGGGIRVDVTFHTSPLFASGPPPGPPPHAPEASASAGASLLEHHQRDDDDD